MDLFHTLNSWLVTGWRRHTVGRSIGLKRALVVGLLVPCVAVAGPRKAVKASQKAGPTASAAEIPALAKLLDKAGWDATPELSGVFQVGRIFLDDGEGHRLMVRS